MMLEVLLLLLLLVPVPREGVARLRRRRRRRLHRLPFRQLILLLLVRWCEES